ncbi:aminoglycoside 3-N-acetyltransferase [Azospirillum halopraeferens]|uniref:aminoglycoside 3-N-acetyltransferase n=1 Tax=Azospirillum halopraeferens TaxID=34010 RepID=UPI0006881AA2|nr:aminoglycoside 3-N-acetyltransferase [Azospirillum halopraeferens]
MTGEAGARTRAGLMRDLWGLGLRPGDVVMVHASLRAVGSVEGGPDAVVGALLDAIAPQGTLLAYVSWDRSPYEETLNSRTLTVQERDAWPAFDPATAGTYPGFGALNAFIVRHPDARRSDHPDASMAAIGPLAEGLVAGHAPGNAFGPGSPLDRFVAVGGRVLLLGAPLDAVTVLHYAEAVAAVPGKRRVTYAMPVLDADGRKVWVRAEDYDSNGILDQYAVPGQPDAVETVMRAYVAERPHRSGRVGDAPCRLFEAPDLVRFAVDRLERWHGTPGAGAG